MTPIELRARIDRGDIPTLSPQTLAAADALARAARAESFRQAFGFVVAGHRRGRGTLLVAVAVAVVSVGASALWFAAPVPL